jgi:hypothetical protein
VAASCARTTDTTKNNGQIKTMARVMSDPLRDLDWKFARAHFKTQIRANVTVGVRVTHITSLWVK